MKASKTIIIITSLLLGSSISAFASDAQDKSNPPSFKGWIEAMLSKATVFLKGDSKPPL